MSRLLAPGWSVLLTLALAALTSGAAGAVYGGQAAWQTFIVLAPIGFATTLLTATLAARRRLLGGLRVQFAAAAAVAIGALLAATAVFVLRMFVSDHDAFFSALLAVYAGALGWWASAMLARGVLSDVESLRAGLHAVGDGARDVAFETRGRDELADLAASARVMTTRLGAEERARRELVAAVSHDLRTPVTNLRLLTDAIEDGLMPPEELSRLGVHVRQLGALIDDLFELSRLEAREIRWSVESVDLSELVSETVEAMRPQAKASSVDVRTELDAQLGPARGNPEQLKRVLFNLIQNAVRHTPADGSIVVRAQPVGDDVEIEVADSGSGIAPADRERVFQAFVRGDDARTSEGAGLGLAIARAIVEAHGGRIWLEDAAVGTSVRFSVPAAV